VLLQWWRSENIRGRHVWPGLNSLKVGSGWEASEIRNQISLTRQQNLAPGQIHWSAAALMKNSSLGSELARNCYRQPALVPRYPWLDSQAPARPALAILPTGRGATATWSAGPGQKPWLWVVQFKQFGDWTTQILPAGKTSIHFDREPDAIAVSVVDRCGNQSPCATAKLDKNR
jgi:hypothetical protein